MDNKEFVVCKICGQQVKRINHLHLRSHKITTDEYVEKFPDAPLTSEAVKKSMSKKMQGRKIKWADKISKSNKESCFVSLYFYYSYIFY